MRVNYISKSPPVRSVNEYLNRISVIRGRLDSGLNLLAFRGQEDGSWELESSAERRLKKSSFGRESVTNEEFIEYHEGVILACKRNGFDRRDGQQLDELELLAHLQHHRAATCLIDFTRSALVALWFASENTDVDGKVFVVNTGIEQFLEITPDDARGHSISEILRFQTRGKGNNLPIGSASQEDLKPVHQVSGFWYWTPANLNERILAQHSLFIFGAISSGRPVVEELTIDATRKTEIREELKEVHNINEDALFPDFVGFAYTQRHDAIYGSTAADYKRLGRNATQRGEHLLSAQFFSNAIRMNANDSRSYAFRAEAYERLGDFDSAIQDYSKMIESDMDRLFAYRRRAEAYERLGDFDSAIQDYSKMIESDMDRLFAYRRRAEAYEKLGDMDNAIGDYSKLIELEPSRLFAYIDRAEAYERFGDLNGAIADYSKLIELDPEGGFYFGLRAGIWLRLQQWDQARSDIATAKNMGFDIPDFFSSEYGSVGDFEERMRVQLPSDIVHIISG